MSEPDANGWLPIETAPKDGWILAYLSGARLGSRIHCARMVDGDMRIVGTGFGFDAPPATNWQPLPAPPVQP